MSSKCNWNVRFNDGTEVTVRAASKRMAQATASVTTGLSADEISGYGKAGGKARNGNKARNPSRPQLYSSRYNDPWDRRPSRRW